jgi:hypothetical protein
MVEGRQGAGQAQRNGYKIGWNQEHSISITAVFSWSIFIRAVIGHMTCYNLNWSKIKL